MGLNKSILQLLVAGLSLLIAPSCTGQKEITDTTYGIMLNTLLEHNVPEISVKEASKKSNTDIIFLDTREQ